MSFPPKEGDVDVSNELREIAERLRNEALLGHHTEQTVIHKTEGMGKWGPAAIVACFAAMLLALGSAVLLSRDNDKLARRVETLEAWQAVNNNAISKMQATIDYMKEKPDVRHSDSR